MYPLVLNPAAITPAFKSGDRTVRGNSLPISVNSNVLERIIRKHVSSFIDMKGYNTQHGFSSGRSCLSAPLNIFDDVMHILDGVVVP